ncbi:MAG: glycosyltransferase family 2 protein [Rickettsiales bacterium]|nr:glycosyltransferase family 2 protein [Rickettsiales bacterium]
MQPQTGYAPLRPETSTLIVGHVFFVLCLSAACLAAPPYIFDPTHKEFFFLVGSLAVWRYSWALVNWLRFLYYTHVRFPAWRRQVEDMGDDGMPPHIYLLVTSFRIGTETTRRVYESVMREADFYQRPCTIVVSIVEKADEVLIKRMFEHLALPDHVKLSIVRIGGTGKRDALACGFRAISMNRPAAGSVVAVIDGDSMLPEGILAKCAPLFTLMPDLGALTTDETCEVEGRWIFREWYNMRFAQRHVFMSSVSMSRRVLTLTGRMSMMRADIVCNPQFIQQVEQDWVDHWRLGRFKFLTGDDKSSWFHILRHGYPMLYVPDVQVVTIETPPDPSFINSSIVLMRRWFGNMLRTNSRAIRLGVRPMGWFPWISIIDQRISMWTALTGPVLAILGTIFVTPLAIFYYILWIAFTRYVITLSLLAARPYVSPWYPLLMYYNQMMGSIIKTFVLFRLDKQKWTRQNTTLSSNRSSFSERMVAFGSAYMHVVSIMLFVTVLAMVTKVISMPDVQFWYLKLKG